MTQFCKRILEWLKLFPIFCVRYKYDLFITARQYHNPELQNIKQTMDGIYKDWATGRIDDDFARAFLQSIFAQLDQWAKKNGIVETEDDD